MKNIFKILLISFISSIVALQSIGQATDGVCADPSSIDPLVAPAVAEVCSDGTTDPPVVFAPPVSSLPNVEFVVEVNGTIITTNADGSIDPTTLAVGDQVCATAVGYSQDGVNDLLNQFQGLCPVAELLGYVPAGTCDVIDAFIAAGGVSSLQDLIDVATAFGVPIGSVADIITAVDGINAAVGGFGLPFVCYATTAAECYTIIECAVVACAIEADLAAAPAAPTVTESTCAADGITLEGGVVDAITCPVGSTAEYSIDGGATWATTVPAYDQTTAITVTVRCLCDEDMTTASPTAEVTTVPGACTPAGGCTVDAGEPDPVAADVCDTDLAAVDVTAVFADPEVAGTPSLNQNYVIVDPANANDIISVSSTAVLDLTGLAVGDQACVVSVAYTQETLDIVTAFVDATLGGICVPVVGPCASDFIGPFGSLDLSGFLNGLNGAFETFGFNFTSDDIALWCANQEITIPLSAIPGGLFPDLVIDLTTIPGLEPDGFCCDFSTATHCLTVIECMMTACEADAPEIDPAMGDCAADDGDMMETPFTWPLNAASTENTTAPYITEYIVTDAASGAIIGVFPTLAAAEAAANAEITADVDGNATACIQPINHDSANLEAIITDLDAQSGGLICGVLPCPVSTLEAFYTAAVGLGATLDVATVVSIIGPPNTGAMGLDLGAVLGLPPGVLVVDVPPFCYELGAEVCATNMDCSAVVTGCTDPCADNYDATATSDDGSCNPYDMTCNADCTAGPFGGAWDATTCACINEEAPVLGCTDPAADNYDAAANCDDGSCMTSSCDLTVGVSALACDDGGTLSDPMDDTADISFAIMTSAASFTVTNITPASGTVTGMNVDFTMVTAGTIISFDVEDADGCTVNYSYTVLDCTVQIPTLSQWGLITLALMLMVMGSLKIGFSTTTFNTVRKN